MPWQYLKSSLAGEEQIGPVTDEQFLALVRQGKIKPKTKIHHGKYTGGDWVEARTSTEFNRAIQSIASEKAEIKAAAKLEQNQRTAEKKRESVLRAQERNAQKAVEKKKKAESLAHHEAAVKDYLSQDYAHGKLLTEIRDHLAHNQVLLTKIHGNTHVIAWILILSAVFWCIGSGVMLSR